MRLFAYGFICHSYSRLEVRLDWEETNAPSALHYLVLGFGDLKTCG
jgi:hypothetical protein